MQLNQLETIEVPFRKLVASTDNVRTTPAEEEATRQLAASIQAVGLLQSLVVQPAPRGKFAVVAGERRYSALALLHDAGQITQSYKVPCRVLPKDADTTEVSLAENVERTEMDVLDEASAFFRIFSNGRSVADIAARFGYSEMLIERRLALARLSPTLMDQYRAGNATLDLLQAFTLTGDHALQEQIWNQLPEWNRNPAMVRRLLSDKDIAASDPQVRFVTLAAYEAAGGQTKRDLFADEDGNGVFITDADLLNRLVNEKLQQVAANIQSEGWHWVEIHPDADYSTLAKFRRIPGEPEPLPRKAEAKRKALQKELDALATQLDGHEDETPECEAMYDRIQQIEIDLEEIKNSRGVSYPDTVRQICGVIVAIDSNGKVRLHQGLLRKEDEAATRADIQAEDRASIEAGTSGGGAAESPDAATGYSAALIQSLTTTKTAAIAAELANQPRIALATVVYTMILQEFRFELDSLQVAQLPPTILYSYRLGRGKRVPPRQSSQQTAPIFAHTASFRCRIMAVVSRSVGRDPAILPGIFSRNSNQRHPDQRPVRRRTTAGSRQCFGSCPAGQHEPLVCTHRRKLLWSDLKTADCRRSCCRWQACRFGKAQPEKDAACCRCRN